MKQKLHNPIGLIIPWSIAFLVFVGYAVYWKIAADKIEKAILAQRNQSFTFSKVEITGFPMRISAHIRDISVDLGKSDHKWRFNFFEQEDTHKLLKIGQLDATTSLFDTNLWGLEKISNIEVFYPSEFDKREGDLIPIKIRNLQASLNIEPKSSGENVIRRLSIIFDKIEIENPWMKLEDRAVQNEIKSEWNPIITYEKGSFHLIRDEKSNQFGLSVDGNIKLNQWNLNYADPKQAANNPNFIKQFEENHLTIRGTIDKIDKLQNGIKDWNDAGGTFIPKFVEFTNDRILFQGNDGKISCESLYKCAGNIKGDFILKTLSHGSYMDGLLKPGANPVNLNFEDSQIPLPVETDYFSQFIFYYNMYGLIPQHLPQL